MNTFHPQRGNFRCALSFFPPLLEAEEEKRGRRNVSLLLVRSSSLRERERQKHGHSQNTNDIFSFRIHFFPAIPFYFFSTSRLRNTRFCFVINDQN